MADNKAPKADTTDVKAGVVPGFGQFPHEAKRTADGLAVEPGTVQDADAALDAEKVAEQVNKAREDASK